MERKRYIHREDLPRCKTDIRSSCTERRFGIGGCQCKMTEVTELYRKVIPLYIQPPVAGQDTVRKPIDFSIESYTGTSGRKEMLLRLTDTNNPFFLHQLVLNEEEYATIKSQQSLLVDFSGFPPKLTELFELCLSESASESPKYLLKFQENCMTDGKSTLSVVETNAVIRHISHLSLTLSLGSDSEVKKYLASCLSKLQMEKTSTESRLNSTICRLQEELSQTQKNLEVKSHDLSVLRADLDSRVHQLEAKYSQAIASLQEKHLQEKTSYQSDSETKRIERENYFQNLISQNDERIKSLESENKELTDRKYKSEATIRDLKSKLSVSDEEVTRLKADLSNFRKDSSGLQSEVHEKEKKINELKMRVAVLEQEIKSKNHIIQRNQEQIDMSNQQVEKADESNSFLKSKITELEKSLKSASDENTKADEIIRKYMEEVKVAHGKVKVKNNVIVQQEKVVKEKTSQLEKTSEELSALKEAIKNKTDEVKKLKEALDGANSKLEENQKLLSSNEQIINYLNKQLTDTQIVQRSNITFGNSTRVASNFSNGDNSMKGKPPIPTSSYHWNSSNHTYNNSHHLATHPESPLTEKPPPHSEYVPFKASTPHGYTASSPNNSPRENYNSELMPSKYLKSARDASEPVVGNSGDRAALGNQSERSVAASVSKHRMSPIQHNMSIASSGHHSTSSRKEPRQPPIMSAYFPAHGASKTVPATGYAKN